jgi:hypothetical protein
MRPGMVSASLFFRRAESMQRDGKARRISAAWLDELALSRGFDETSWLATVLNVSIGCLLLFLLCVNARSSKQTASDAALFL